MPSYAFNRSGSSPVDHRTHLGGLCNIPINRLTLCECFPERLPCLVEYLKATQLFPRSNPRITSHVYNIYETIPPLDTTWYTIWAKVIVIVATYRRVVTTHSPEYNTFRKAMKRKMEQERIPGFVGSTADQWVAFQAHALTIPPVPHRSPLWQTNTRRGQRFPECFDYLLRNIAKKHNNNLENLLRAPVAGPARPAAPVAAVNDRKSSQNICTE